MLFSSITFLYFFLPMVLLLHAFVPDKGKNLVLLFMSILFYAWGEPVYVFLMLLQILISYMLTWLMDKYNKSAAGKGFMFLSVAVPFLALIFFKYSGFLLEDIFGIKVPFFSKLSLPIGISFYTFQIVSYNIDVWKKRVPRQKSLITLATYVTLFPQLVAGPIVRYSEIEQTLIKNKENRGNTSNPFNFEKFEYGVVRFATGLGKKVLIANVLGEFVAEASALSARGIVLSWAYAFAVALQIYFDFSGYSDMAIGLGSMLGFSFPENFRYPFISKSISEFWRRWHITLGSWFRDYVYIPLGGNRVSNIRWIFNILVVWLFTGLWHGADWNFIIWGLMFAVLLVFEKLVTKLVEKIFSLSKSELSKKIKITISILQHIYVIFVIVISFLIFHNSNLNQLLKDIQSLFDNDVNKAVNATYVLRNRIGILMLALVGCTPLPKLIWDKVECFVSRYAAGELIIYLLRGIAAIGLIVLCTAYLIDGSFNPFLYFRF